MQTPTPRQQAGYLRRLLRRGEIEVVDPISGRALPALVELRGPTVRIVPSLHEPGLGADEARADRRWLHLLRRLRDSISLDEAEELVEAVEVERSKGELAAPRS